MSTVVKAFAKCLSTLDTVRSGTLKSHSDLPHAEEHMMCKFWLFSTSLLDYLAYSVWSEALKRKHDRSSVSSCHVAKTSFWAVCFQVHTAPIFS